MIHAYVRISVGKEKDSVSLEYQERDIRTAFGSKYPEIVFHREAASAVKNDRPVWEILLKTLRSEDILLAWSVDRLMRNLDDLPLLAGQMDTGVRIRTVRDGDFFRDQLLMFGVRAIFAVEEPRRSKERQHARFVEGIKKGEWFFAIPFGLKRSKGIISIDSEKAPAILQLFRKYLNHPGGIGTFVPEAQKIFLPYGHKTSRTRIHKMLRNEIYRAILRYRNEVSYGLIPALIPTSLFMEVQNKLNGNRHNKAITHQHLYRNLITCSCKRTLTGELQKGRVYYRCHSKACAFTAIREDVLDECVADFLKKHSFTREGIKKYLALIKEQKKESFEAVVAAKKAASNSLIQAERSLDGLYDMRAADEIDAETFTLKKSALLQKIQLLKEEIVVAHKNVPRIFEIVEKMFEFLNTRQNSWSLMDSEEKRLLLKMLGSNFRIAPEKALTMSIFTALEDFMVSDSSEWCTMREDVRTVETFCQTVEETYLRYSQKEKDCCSRQRSFSLCETALVGRSSGTDGIKRRGLARIPS